MCLLVKEGCEPQIAQEDIFCYKQVQVALPKKLWRSPVKGNVWAYNKVAKAENNGISISTLRVSKVYHVGWEDGERVVQPGALEIEVGFHAFLCKKVATWGLTRPAIIPKGAMYCLGRYDEIVATQIIVFSSEKAYSRYVKQH